MKKQLLLLIFLIAQIHLFATHIIGGSITYKHMGGDMYEIKMEVFRDCYNGLPAFDNPAYLGIFDAANNLVDSFAISFNGVSDTLSYNLPNSICIFPPDVCVEKTVYDTTITLLPTIGGYTLAYQRCCRSFEISNLINPEDVGITLHTHINTVLLNSSPNFSNNIPPMAFVGSSFSYDASAQDVDGDSLVYELIAPYLGADDDIPAPTIPSAPPYDPALFITPTYSVFNMIGGTTPLAMDEKTGELTAIPNTLGSFKIAYQIKEYRNGEWIGTTHREFTIVVIAGISAQNYDVSGQVLVDGNMPLDTGKVLILERDIVTDSLHIYDEQNIGTNGMYNFTGIPKGVFYIQAQVDSTSQYYNSHLPTYYNSSSFWYQSTPIDQCDTIHIDQNIHLIHVDSLTGSLILNGLVVQSNNNTVSVPNLNLFLGNENGDLLQARRTNADGEFRFENLTAGNYKIYVDLINSPIDNINPPEIELNGSSSALLYLYSDSLSLENLNSVNVDEIEKKYTLSIFPNPTDSQVSLKMELPESEISTLKIYNALGQEIQSVFENKFLPKGQLVQNINMYELDAGIYWLHFQGEHVQFVKKIIRN